MYSIDHDDLLPQPGYWMEAVQPYLIDPNAFRIYDEPPRDFKADKFVGNPHVWAPGSFDTVLNLHIAGENLKLLEEQFREPSSSPPGTRASTPLIFESPGREWNAVGDPRENPSTLRNGSDGIPIKCLAFVDGHAKILKKPDFEALVPDPVCDPTTHKAKSP